MAEDRNTIIEAARKAGIVGAGGAGFPTHIKLQVKVNALIINGAECEPLLANDKAQIVHNTSDLLRGIELAVKATGAKRAVIAIKNKYKDVISHLRKRSGSVTLEIFELEDYYPAGDEQEIVHEITGYTVPEAGLPLDVGIVVQNVETLINLGRAIGGEPVITRTLTVVGEVAHPGVVNVPIGMSAKEIIESCGGLTCDNPVLYIGGPMMGVVQDSLDQPVTKTSSGLFILPADNFLITKRSISLRHILRQAQAACTSCMQCTEACPRNLLGHQIRPHKIMNAVTLGLTEQSDVFMEAYLCMFCGMCEYACPMWLSPKRVYEEVRASLQAKGMQFERSVKSYQDDPMRKYRRVPSDRLIRRYELKKYAVELSSEIQQLDSWKVRIPMSQHLGAPASPIVAEGDYVQKGQLIGEIPENKLGARVHASIEGRITYAGTDAIVIER